MIKLVLYFWGLYLPIICGFLFFLRKYVFPNQPMLSLLVFGVVFISYFMWLELRPLKWDKSGRGLLLQRKYEEAIGAYQESYRYFTQYRWLDDYKWLLLFSGGRSSFREDALSSIGYCYAMLGDIKKAEEYDRILQKEFPNSDLLT